MAMRARSAPASCANVVRMILSSSLSSAPPMAMIGPGPVAPAIKLSITSFSMTSGVVSNSAFFRPVAIQPAATRRFPRWQTFWTVSRTLESRQTELVTPAQQPPISMSSDGAKDGDGFARDTLQHREPFRTRRVDDELVDSGVPIPTDHLVERVE